MATRIARLRMGLLVLVPVLGTGTLLSACGSASSATIPASVVTLTCQKVNAALSDGPDPTADPIGYAEAQIRPLAKIKVHDTQLQKAIAALDSAYTQYFHTSGGPGTSSSVKAALKAVATYCPGVGS